MGKKEKVLKTGLLIGVSLMTMGIVVACKKSNLQGEEALTEKITEPPVEVTKEIEKETLEPTNEVTTKPVMPRPTTVEPIITEPVISKEPEQEPTVTPTKEPIEEKPFAPHLSKDGKKLVIDQAGTTLLVSGSKELSITGINTLKSNEIVLPDSVDGKKITGIFNRAFYSGKTLKKITLPKYLNFIEEGAFYGCTALSEVVVHKENEKFIVVDGVLFDYSKETLILYPSAKKGATYEIPTHTLAIAERAFADSFALTHITIPESVTYIGAYAFADCYSLSTIEIPKNVTVIHEGTFTGCEGLLSVTVHGALSEVEYVAFANCTSLEEISFLKGVNTLGGLCFTMCTGLKHIALPDGLTLIKDMAFYHCYGLMQVTVPSSVVFIGKDVFEGIKGITIIAELDSYAYEYAMSANLSVNHP